MRFVLAVLVTAFLAALIVPAAHAQRTQKRSQPNAPQSELQKKKQRDAEKAYRQSLEKIPDQKPVDPWAKVR